jgi:hypothetical protein
MGQEWDATGDFMSEQEKQKYTGKKYFTIHRNDAGTEAYHDRYVEWLEQQLADLKAQRLRELGEIDSALGEYLLSGGLFNPEAMNPEKVREMIMTIRTRIAAMKEEPE